MCNQPCKISLIYQGHSFRLAAKDSLERRAQVSESNTRTDEWIGQATLWSCYNLAHLLGIHITKALWLNFFFILMTKPQGYKFQFCHRGSGPGQFPAPSSGCSVPRSDPRSHFQNKKSTPNIRLPDLRYSIFYSHRLSHISELLWCTIHVYLFLFTQEHRFLVVLIYQWQAFQFIVLPSGLSLELRVFRECMQTFLSTWMNRGIRVLPYFQQGAGHLRYIHSPCAHYSTLTRNQFGKLPSVNQAIQFNTVKLNLVARLASSVTEWWPAQGVPHLSLKGSWDWLQLPANPDGCFSFLVQEWVGLTHLTNLCFH